MTSLSLQILSAAIQLLARMNKRGKRGHPCLSPQPLENLIQSLGKPLFKEQNFLCSNKTPQPNLTVLNLTVQGMLDKGSLLKYQRFFEDLITGLSVLDCRKRQNKAV